MNLDHGGHLTHGSPVNFSGTYFHIVPYGVNDEGFIDYDKVMEIALECKPKMIIAGASAYARTIDFKKFREIADACGAVLMVDMAHIAGLVAAVSYTHLYEFYLDLRKYGSARHAGFGLGFERCVMYLTGMSNIRDVIPFPRTVNNCEL